MAPGDVLCNFGVAARVHHIVHDCRLMQTFLPYPSFADSAEVLDRQRLGKQRVENLQIMQWLFRYKLVTTAEEEGKLVDLPEQLWHLRSVNFTSYSNHPAVLMWCGYSSALLVYQRAICDRWTSLEYADTCLRKTESLWMKVTGSRLPAYIEYPEWLGDEAFHRAHQSNLLRKDPDHYGQFFPGVPDNLPYIWPV